MKVFNTIIKRQEYRARREALIQLRAMTDRALIDCNFSPELVKEGIKAWPWQNPSEEVDRLRLEPSTQLNVDAKHAQRNAMKTTVEQEQTTELTPNKREEQVSHRTAA